MSNIQNQNCNGEYGGIVLTETNNNASNLIHNIFIEERKKMVLSGINDVVSFEEDNVALKTVKGKLTVRGNGMRMESFHSELGELIIYGDIYAVVYTDDATEKSGIISRLFK